ncbi:lysylphosphatidylglycerol synthase transmembrane domain-containing protein [Peptostreptococcus faecalis]|uniref:lysylphosphatidylglycerol synthase transmembrane domain-containing protein n=1 Tax=Peptostreptococcus faecalis TaxID=2045015 RepID=UPI000C7BE9CC|nr:lysylphosphatidylglycerol synthase transmembrane domain-containing protein [Peptostreptococcus faecalis]
MEGLKSKKSQFLGIGIMVVIMVGYIAYVLKDESPTEIINAIKNVKPTFMLIALGLMAFYIICEGINIWIMMKALNKKTNIKNCLGYGFVGFYFSSITPSASGGQPAQIFFMKRDGISMTSSSLGLMVVFVAHQLVVIAYGIAAFFSPISDNITQMTGVKLLLLYGFLSNAVILLAIALLIFSPKTVFKILNVSVLFLYKIKLVKNLDKMKNKISVSIQEYEAGAIYMKNNPKVILHVTLVTMIQIAALFIIPYFIYKGFGLSGFSMWDLMFAQAILNIAVSALPLPGAVGASESVFVGLFRIFFGSGLVIPAMLLTRIANFYSVLIISGIISLVMYITTTKNISANKEIKEKENA